MKKESILERINSGTSELTESIAVFYHDQWKHKELPYKPLITKH